MLAVLNVWPQVFCYNISFLPVAAIRELVFPLLEEQLQKKSLYA